MENFIFHEALPTATVAFDFEPTLFHDPRQLFLQRTSGWKWYYATHRRHRRVIASLFLNIDNGYATGSVNSPFGTIECSPALASDVLYQFLAFVEEKLQAQNISGISLRFSSFPMYQTHGLLLQSFLFMKGYQVTDTKTGMVRPIAGDFAHGLKTDEVKKLRKAKKRGLTIRQMTSESLQDVYSIIARRRERKGYRLSMTVEELSRVVSTFPEQYPVFGLFSGDDTLIGGAIAVRISSKILYNFYADNEEEYDGVSPAVLLMEGLYNYGMTNSMTLLDMGTSEVNGQPNFGLITFKMRLAGIPTTQLTLEKKLT